MIGVSFELSNRYDYFIHKVLSNIINDTDNILILSGEVFDKIGNFLFEDKVYSKSEFENIVSKKLHYIVFLSIAVYDKQAKLVKINSFDDYRRAKPKLFLSVCDSIFASCYSYDKSILDKIRNDSLSNSFNNLSDETKFYCN